MDHIHFVPVFDDKPRLAQFNGVLQMRWKSKTVQHAPIVDYEEFFGLPESFVLELMFEAKLIAKEKYQVLQGALNRRNHFAHPNFAKTTGTSAAGYIEDLVINVIDDPAPLSDESPMNTAPRSK